ncbi:MAG: VWA domain-containing protein [Spirochaetales bacterium]|nr:VWA domain-containing protein [Spirochaetales bacterium]
MTPGRGAGRLLKSEHPEREMMASERNAILKGFLKTVAVILLLAFESSALLGARSSVLVLPFRIEGDPARARLDISRPDMSRHLQEATHFLLPRVRDYPLESLEATRSATNRAGWSFDQSFDQEAGQSLCRTSGVTYLLAGTARFVSPERNFISFEAYSCPLLRVLNRDEKSDSIYHLQGVLRRTLQGATPFLTPARRPGLPAAPGATDLAVVLDLSGSMIFDLESIRSGLAHLGSTLPPGSRLGLVTINGGDAQDVHPLDEDWPGVLRWLQSRVPGGEVSLRGLENAVATVERFREWRGRRQLLLFSDATAGGRRMVALESRLRRLAGAGVAVGLFALYGQSYEDRQEYFRLARSLSLPEPLVYYARRASFAEGEAQYLITDGRRFFCAPARASVAASIAGGGSDTVDWEPIETVTYEQGTLNLRDLPRAYAERERLRLVELGPVLSNLERRIATVALHDAGQGTQEMARVLLRNESTSFWIRVAEHRVLTALQNARGQDLYVGLHVQSASAGAERIRVLPTPIHVLGAGAVPLLLVNTWERLNRTPEQYIDPEDTWFLRVRVLEVERGR